jgi:hypothetical protein
MNAMLVACRIVGWVLALLWLIGGLTYGKPMFYVSARILALVLVATHFIHFHPRPVSMGK